MLLKAVKSNFSLMPMRDQQLPLGDGGAKRPIWTLANRKNSFAEPQIDCFAKKSTTI